MALNRARSRIWAGVVAIVLLPQALTPAVAETLPDALVRAYQGNPQLNAERAKPTPPSA